MNILQIVNRSIAQGVRAAGNAAVEVLVAQSVPFEAQPGQDYEPTWAIHDGVGFLEKVEVADYPTTSVQVGDVTMVLVMCEHDVDMHEYVKFGETVYHVYGIKPEYVGQTRVLQKLLLRAEKKGGIEWESRDQSATSI